VTTAAANSVLYMASATQTTILGGGGLEYSYFRVLVIRGIHSVGRNFGNFQ
jgi:hypothetical protein